MAISGEEGLDVAQCIRAHGHQYIGDRAGVCPAIGLVKDIFDDRAGREIREDGRACPHDGAVIDSVKALAAVDGVIAAEDVLTGKVIAIATVDGIIAIATDQRIVAVKTVEDIISFTAGQIICRRATGDRIAVTGR